MEFYSNTKPSLMSMKLRKDFYEIINKKSDPMFVKDYPTSFIVSAYKTYIEPNFLLILLLAIIGFILYTRYRSTQEEKTDKETFVDQKRRKNEGIIRSLESLKRKPIVHDIPENHAPGIPVHQTLNPLYPVAEQTVYIDNNHQYNPENRLSYNGLNNVYDYPMNTQHYIGTHAVPFMGTNNGNYFNPYGRTDNYNQTTNNFGNYMIANNVDKYVDYEKLLRESGLLDANYGPNSLNLGLPELEMEPPYSD